MSAYILILTYHQDPAHGWIEVPAELMDRLGILESVSEYSYFSFTKQAYFLEEDQDANLLLEVLKDQGIEYVLRDKMYHANAPMRRMSRVGSSE